MSMMPRPEYWLQLITGKGPMPKDGWTRFQGLRLPLDMRNSACVLFDSAKLRHSTEECELSRICTHGSGAALSDDCQ